ncbi:DTW domain-containing protein [Glaciimonas sp. CA11.2]|nr:MULTISPECIES: DTW domain-containing protein [unclassified Glaciimonas]MDY7546286.1 DTW domain-containing protein [Glaciimonas sp. CA11.2]MEB0010765.1 DTW domain-containing protein [Glaciimonas sp. Cout2]MEB0082099.1 DTW domain-containing protein [Glaciimonas sp. Gout2]MEB0163232.1 DTW domain-containing protein [Glaciimonas sp. CA11.2]
MRCAQCARPQSHCLCGLIPRIESRTRILLLQHPSEANHALNTARLAALGLVNAELLIGEVFPKLPALISQAEYQTCLLFPSDDAQPLVYTEDTLASQPLLIVVLDGTWRKARKLLHVNPALATLPRFVLPAGLQSRYRVRKTPAPGMVSTLEAIVCALNVIEAPRNFDALLTPFEALIDQQITAMGPQTYMRNHGSINQPD